MPDNAYIAIDLKSFYASVECVKRGLDPLTTNLVVADESRTTTSTSYSLPALPTSDGICKNWQSPGKHHQ